MGRWKIFGSHFGSAFLRSLHLHWTWGLVERPVVCVHKIKCYTQHLAVACQPIALTLARTVRTCKHKWMGVKIYSNDIRFGACHGRCVYAWFCLSEKAKIARGRERTRVHICVSVGICPCTPEKNDPIIFGQCVLASECACVCMEYQNIWPPQMMSTLCQYFSCVEWEQLIGRPTIGHRLPIFVQAAAFFSHRQLTKRMTAHTRSGN